MRVTCHITSEWFRAVTGDEPPVAGNHPCMPRLRRRAESMLEKAVRTRYRYKRRLRFGFRGYGDTNRGFWFLVFKPQMTPRRRRQPEIPKGRRQTLQTTHQMENYTSSRTSTDGSAHLGAPDRHPESSPTDAHKSPGGGKCKNTTTQVHVKLLWVTLLGNYWGKY